jgi:hypothetical protein
MLLVAVLLCLIPRAASAQTEPKLGGLVSGLIFEGITLPGGADPGRPHAGHFSLLNPTFGGSQSNSKVSQDAIRAVGAFNDRFRSQLVNFPLGSSSGGFTFTRDATLGVYTRRSNSFGPAFTERAETIGRGQFSAGFNFQFSNFDSFGGENLDDGSIRFYLPHTDCCPNVPAPSLLNPGFEGDVMEAALDLSISTQTFAFFGTYGVTDRFDIGFAIPFSRVSLDADVDATILRLSTSADPTIHTFEEGSDVHTARFSASGSAAGVGDITLRSKFNFLTHPQADLSLGFDLRLPTGDEEDLLGTGAAQAKVYVIASSAGARVSPHLNIGFTLSGSGNTDPEYNGIYQPLGISHEFNYAGGVEFVASPRLTVVGDLIGRTLFDAGNVEPASLSFLFVRQGASTIERSDANPITGEPYEQLALRPGNLNLLLAAGGFKFNPAPNFLVAANVLFPISSGGLRDYFTLSLGLDFAF